MLVVDYLQMKTRSTTPVSTPFYKRAMLVTVSVFMIVSTPFAFTKPAKADKYDQQIAALQRDINQYNSQASKLGQKRQSYENKLAQLNNEKAQIQARIGLTIAKANKLQKEIKENQAKITANKDELGETIADLYVGGSISPLEMLASSNNIGDYLDKQTYQVSIRDNLKGTIDTINALKKKLEDQKASVERVLAEQNRAKSALAKKEAEQAELIRVTRGKESAFQKLSGKAKQQRAEVQRQQQAAIEAALSRSGSGPVIIGSGGGGYPWASGCNVGEDLYSHGGPNGDGTDPLGYACRQCTSYAAYKILQHTGREYRYLGNANMWPANFSNKGSSPRKNSVGVVTSGQYGHVVWVDSVNGDGTINISQYNYYNAGGPGYGHFSRMKVPASSFDTYIYF